MRHLQVLLYADIILKRKHTKVSLITSKEVDLDVMIREPIMFSYSVNRRKKS
jgi:hypothetical protein